MLIKPLSIICRVCELQKRNCHDIQPYTYNFVLFHIITELKLKHFNEDTVNGFRPPPYAVQSFTLAVANCEKIKGQWCPVISNI